MKGAKKERIILIICKTFARGRIISVFIIITALTMCTFLDCYLTKLAGASQTIQTGVKKTKQKKTNKKKAQ